VQTPVRRDRLAELRNDPQLYRMLLEHAARGVRVQLLLRAALVIFVLVTILAEPPVHDEGLCLAVACVYAVWASLVAMWSWQGGERPVRHIWVTLFVDLAALGAVTVLASRSDVQSWTADILVNGFFVLPMLASTQLRPGVAAMITVPTVAVYLGSSIAARHANGEPWASIILRTGVIAALSGGCVLMSWVARSRVLTIIGLVSERRGLVVELAGVETTARRELADELHDGALQYLLAARLDLDDARSSGEAVSFDRLDEALRESTALLRAKVSQLHPAVLQQAGLRRALEDLVSTVTARTGLPVEIAADGWDVAWRTADDELLYGAARELLTNVAKHAQASKACLSLCRGNGMIHLTVSDDGVGVADDALERRLAEGHVGLASQRIRAEAAGGTLTLRSGAPGTVVQVVLPDTQGATPPA
jgi:two-component system NarL family sensor kinase